MMPVRMLESKGMASPALSVAMSVYNGERFLDEAIASVSAQTFADFEFLVLDDGSQDGTRDIIEAHAARDARIRPIVRENRGLVASLNELLAGARAPLVARMDADDICMPHRFAAQIAFLEANPDYGVVGSRSIDIDEFGKPYTVAGEEHPDSHAQFLAAIDSGGPLLCHPAVMYRRETVLGVGGYHAAFRHCEDLDLWLRLASATKLASVPERLLFYRHYAGQVSSRHATEQQVGAAIAYLAYQERQAGRPDPTAALDQLPPLDELDALFGRAGVARSVRARVAPSLLYSPVGLRDAGFELIVRHLRDGGRRDGMWRTVARLLSFGEPVRAARLAATLAIS